MPLFQQSVLKKYLNELDKLQLQAAWRLFEEHFLNPVIQQNISDSKEEEYQEGFVRDLFVKVLGYTLNPQPDYNFVLEKKTVTDATKSDGAVLLNKEVIGVVELKDTGTPDLDKVSNQAFDYKHKHKNCTYIITSNFEKLRFYINDSTDYEEFELFNLTQQRFALLYLCLHTQNLLAGIPLKIKQASLVQEENVTKKLYADYSVFKRKLFQNTSEQNSQYDKLLLFKKTQKLLDRFLFILFAEDRLLLPPNSVREILKQWEDLKTQYDEYFPLYGRFKKYFGYLNTGHVGKQHEIFAYNGGLFMADEVLDNITIDDAILFEGTKTLSTFDFATDVDVNILGHIFEHSLTEIEELQAEMEGKPVEKNKTKRKKDGVFYTPRYITKYIVENTVGALCTQKKEELQINEETFSPKKRKERRKLLLDKIDDYRNWLLQLTICNPACGSGAFLNAALEYLIAEHRTVDELKARIFGDAIVYTDIENSILENNLYGVDINEDAIEIAKLSLWLHTAKKGRKLSNLSNNIKCGNSLIDDASVAGDKAFNWQKEFPAVFGKKSQLFLEFIKHLQEGLKVYNITAAEEQAAFEKLKPSTIQLLAKSTGNQINNLHDYITAFFLMLNGEEEDTGFLWLSLLMKHPDNEQLVKEFSEGSNVPTQAIYYVLIKNFLKDLEENFDAYEEFYLAQQGDDENVGFDVVIGNPPYGRYSQLNEDVKEYLRNNILYGETSDLSEFFIRKVLKSLIKKEGFFSFIVPKGLTYVKAWSGIRELFLSEVELIKLFDTSKAFDEVLYEMVIFVIKNSSPIQFEVDCGYYDNDRLTEYKFLKSLFSKNIFYVGFSKSYLPIIERIKRTCKPVSNYIDFWYGKGGMTPLVNFDGVGIKVLTGKEIGRYSLNNIDKEWFIETTVLNGLDIQRAQKEKVVVQDIVAHVLNPKSHIKLTASLDTKQQFCLNTVMCFSDSGKGITNKFLLGVINSKFISFYYYYFVFNQAVRTMHFMPGYSDLIPIPVSFRTYIEPIESKADIMLSKNKELNQSLQQVTQLLEAKFPSININNKLQAWPSLKPNEFLKELQKQKIKLTLSEQQEWLQYFEEQKIKATSIQQIIQQTDKEIDAMVYELYGLTQEEITIVEGK